MFVPDDCQLSLIPQLCSIKILNWILKAPGKIVLQGLLPASGYQIWKCIKTHHEDLKTGFYLKWWVVLAIDTVVTCFTIVDKMIVFSSETCWKVNTIFCESKCLSGSLGVHSVLILKGYLHVSAHHVHRMVFSVILKHAETFGSIKHLTAVFC